jgi:hypothetical protein
MLSPQYYSKSLIDKTIKLINFKIRTLNESFINSSNVIQKQKRIQNKIVQTIESVYHAVFPQHIIVKLSKTAEIYDIFQQQMIIPAKFDNYK